MASINKVILIGNLGADPETRQTLDSGTAICSLRLATTRRWRDKDGNLQEETEWHRVVVFGRMAENCAKYLRKGSSVYVEGRLRTTAYEKDGIKRYSTDIVAEQIQFLSNRGEADSSSAYQPQPRAYSQNSFETQREQPVAPQQPSAPAPQSMDALRDDDIPF